MLVTPELEKCNMFFFFRNIYDYHKVINFCKMLENQDGYSVPFLIKIRLKQPYLNSFLASVPIFVKTPENLQFSGVFMGYKMGLLARNRLNAVKIFFFFSRKGFSFDHIGYILSWLDFQMLKGALSGLRQLLATENPLKMMKNTLYFTSKILFVLKTFKFLS